LPTIDTRRQGSTYAVFLFAKKPCFITCLIGLFSFLSNILTFGCSSILHYTLRDLNLVYFLLLVFLLIVLLVAILITPQNQVLIKI